MTSRRPTALICAGLTLAAALVVGPATAARGAPRIVKARMVDVDGDQRADRVVLVYSERVRHARDADGRYPFRVNGHRIRSISAARSRRLVIHLRPGSKSDVDARPAISYARTKKDAVTDRGGTQARAQTFSKTLAIALVQPGTTEASVRVTGGRGGIVTSDPAGITCDPRCYAVYPLGTALVFTATPGDGFRLDSWTGACAGAVDTSCTITLVDDVVLGATFTSAETTGDDEAGGGVLPGDPLPLPLPGPPLPL